MKKKIKTIPLRLEVPLWIKLRRAKERDEIRSIQQAAVESLKEGLKRKFVWR